MIINLLVIEVRELNEQNKEVVMIVAFAGL